MEEIKDELEQVMSVKGVARVVSRKGNMLGEVESVQKV